MRGKNRQPAPQDDGECERDCLRQERDELVDIDALDVADLRGVVIGQQALPGLDLEELGAAVELLAIQL